MFLSNERNWKGWGVKSNQIPEDRKNVPMPPALAGLLWVHRNRWEPWGSEPSPLGSGTLPVGLAGHVCNLFLFLDTSAHAI